MTTLLWLPINLLQHALVLLWSALCISASIVAFAVTWSRDVPLKMARSLWAPGILRITGATLEVDPLPDVDWAQPHIYVMNHQSMVDIPAAFASIPAHLRFVAKHTLKYWPFFGWYMAMTGMVFVNRSDRRQAVKSLRLAGERIRAGASIIAYPEGTRSPDGRLLPFKKGIFVVATEAGVPIVPVAIHGSAQVLRRDGLRMRPGRVRVKVGRPIPTAGVGSAGRDALMARVHAELGQLVHEVGGPADVAQPPAAATLAVREVA